MKLLLDTHVFIWCREDSPRLRRAARKAILEAEDVFVSVASAWEATIKVSLGRLRFPGRFEEAITDSGFDKLLVQFRHVEAVASLPWHHRDPFDRILLAQSLCEGLTLVTHDRALSAYKIATLVV